MDDDGEALDKILMNEINQPEPLQGLTEARDSLDYRRASQAQQSAIQETYRRFHVFIDLQISRLQSQDNLLDMVIIDTLDGIKRRSTVNLFNLFTRSGKLTEIERE